jgi:hypothetical protein
MDLLAMSIPAISSKHGFYYKKDMPCLNSYCDAKFRQGTLQARLLDGEALQLSR